MAEQQQMTPEQVQELQEKIKNMSPEELKEFQKKQCIFCNIIAGQVQSKKIYEDEKVLGILDINPANPGHILLMPKEHYPIMPLIQKDELDQLAYVSKAISQIMLKVLKVEGTTIFIANGVAAGQRAQHFMLHIIPRKESDELPLNIPENTISEAELEPIKNEIQNKINEIFKIKQEKIVVKPKEVKPQEIPKAVPKKIPKEIIKESPKQVTKEFVASVSSKKYHKPECRFAKMISSKNKIMIDLREVKKRKLEPCKCIKEVPKVVEKKKPKESVDLDSIADLFTR